MKSRESLVLVALLLTQFTLPTASRALTPPSDPAILIIGASYANASTPFNDALDAPLAGISVNAGRYLAVGNAVVRDVRTQGFVINEAEAGATTFSRLACGPGGCGPSGWHGYDTQLAKAMARVAVRDPADPSRVASYNSDSVIISTPNDCMHSDAFGIPQSQTVPCGPSELDAVIDRLIAVGRTALANGITPVYEAYPAFSDLDLALTQELFGFVWMINETSFTYLRSRQQSRIRSELPGSLVVDPWENFQHIGDGLHPMPSTASTAGRILVSAILQHRRH